MSNIKIILAEDHHIVRNGIKSLLQLEEGLEIIGEAENGNQVFTLINSGVMPDLIIADINMPEMDGLTLSAQLQEEYPEIKVIILSMMDHEKYIIQAFNSGVKGYLLKNASIQEMMFAIRHIDQGHEYICSEVTLKIFKKVARAPENNNHTSNQNVVFTPRELEILKLTAEGYTNMEMANKLFTSRRTIEGHRQSLIDKTGAKNSAALIVYAFRAGILR
ncbi:MAG: Response regulator receiver protein [Sphingobacteriales bacterium]|nr:Response regulator receiver protein [Sphingobacteriales bacterium]